MGQCCRKQIPNPNVIKQDKNIDDKRMLKVGIEILKKDFCVQIGYNQRAVKTYGPPEVRQEGNKVEDLTPSAEGFALRATLKPVVS